MACSRGCNACWSSSGHSYDCCNGRICFGGESKRLQEARDRAREEARARKIREYAARTAIVPKPTPPPPPVKQPRVEHVTRDQQEEKTHVEQRRTAR